MSQLIDLLAGKTDISQMTTAQWNLLLTEARQANMMARLASVIANHHSTRHVPDAARDILESSQAYVAYLQLRARHELTKLADVAAKCAYPVVLLKGAAYLFTGSNVCQGRGMSDIDVMVPRDCISDFEEYLNIAGWQFADDLSKYDEHYYRNLAHELPPMRNPNCQLELDVHHNILQPTHRYAVDASRLFDACSAVQDSPFSVLERRDQILHSAAHLTMSDELRGGLRDAYDIRELISEGRSADPDFIDSLFDRADELGLQLALHYVLQYLNNQLGLSLEESSLRRLRRMAPPIYARVMYPLVRMRLKPSGSASGLDKISEQILYVRSHWIRMPPFMLAEHLWKKYRMPATD